MLFQIPSEFLYVVFDHLDGESLVNLANTCRYFNDHVVLYSLQAELRMFSYLHPRTHVYGDAFFGHLGLFIQRITSHIPDVKTRFKVFEMIAEKRICKIVIRSHIPDDSNIPASVEFLTFPVESSRRVLGFDNEGVEKYVWYYGKALRSFSQKFTSCELIDIFENSFDGNFDSKLLAAVHRDLKLGIAVNEDSMKVIRELLYYLYVDAYYELRRTGQPNHYRSLLQHIVTSGGNDARDIDIMMHVTNLPDLNIEKNWSSLFARF